MPARIGSAIYDSAGRSFRLGQELGRGAQGSVWSLDGNATLVAKLYHQGLSAIDRQKLGAMCNIGTDDLCKIAAWPMAMLAEQRGGQPTGVLMPRVTAFPSIHVL